MRCLPRISGNDLLLRSAPGGMKLAGGRQHLPWPPEPAAPVAGSRPRFFRFSGQSSIVLPASQTFHRRQSLPEVVSVNLAGERRPCCRVWCRPKHIPTRDHLPRNVPAILSGLLRQHRVCSSQRPGRGQLEAVTLSRWTRLQLRHLTSEQPAQRQAELPFHLSSGQSHPVPHRRRV